MLARLPRAAVFAATSAARDPHVSLGLVRVARTGAAHAASQAEVQGSDVEPPGCSTFSAIAAQWASGVARPSKLISANGAAEATT